MIHTKPRIYGWWVGVRLRYLHDLRCLHPLLDRLWSTVCLALVLSDTVICGVGSGMVNCVA